MAETRRRLRSGTAANPLLGRQGEGVTVHEPGGPAAPPRGAPLPRPLGPDDR
ncbi:hypothetical protein ACWEN3_05410 [Streptomyces sp. NPDC004561]